MGIFEFLVDGRWHGCNQRVILQSRLTKRGKNSLSDDNKWKDWGNAAVTSSTDIPLKSWHHLAATYDAKTGQAKVYLDGRPDGKGKIGGTIKANNDVLWLGRGQGPFLDGRMDEVRISNIARTEEEIKTLMEKGIESMLAISPKSKLAISWGYLKTKP